MFRLRQFVYEVVALDGVMQLCPLNLVRSHLIMNAKHAVACATGPITGQKKGAKVNHVLSSRQNRSKEKLNLQGFSLKNAPLNLF